MLASFHSSYLTGGLRAGAFLSRGLGDAADRLAAVEDAAARAVPSALLAELATQQATLPHSAPRAANLAALGEAGTVVVATGQQVGLFLGPLYTLHKAASAIVLARWLAEETGRRVVPLFWLQTEDHDFAEIAAAISPRRDGTTLRSQLVDDQPGARVSIAQRRLPAMIVKLLDDLGEELAARPHAAEVDLLLRAHYREGASLAAAFAGVLATIFADDGLLLFNPRNRTTALLQAPLMRRAFDEAAALEALLVERKRAMEAAGFAAPIELRPGSPLPFYHAESATGPRQRLAGLPPDWPRVLEADPLRFSTSALLRPLVQDALFPVAAYVGGPAEVGYLAELQPLYSAFGLTPSLVAPRAQLRLVPPVVRRALDALGRSAREIAEAPLQTEAHFVDEPDAPSAAWATELEARLVALATRDPALGRMLAPAIERTRASVGHALSRLAERYRRAATERHESTTARWRRARVWLAPDGAPQERTLAFPAFAAEVGIGRLRERLIASIDPYSPSLREVDL